MSKQPVLINARRRGFLQGTAVVGAAALTGQVQAEEVVAVVEPEPSAPATGRRGYRNTEHVRRYYERARF